MSSVNHSLPCDVVILPGDELVEKVVLASQKLAPFGSLFTLEVGRYFPHASLFMLQLREDDIETAKNLLADIARASNPLSLKASRFDRSQGFIDVEYARTESIDNVQRRVITALNTIRDGMRAKDAARMSEATGLALENFQRYDYKYVGELFRPHITFTRFDDGSDHAPEARDILPDTSVFDGTFVKLGLFEMGDNGTCVRKIAEFDSQAEPG